MTYREAMNDYGSDKPDTRFGMKIKNLSDVFAGSEFKVFSDALDAEYIASLASRLRGCLYNARALSAALGSENAQSHDIAALLTREI